MCRNSPLNSRDGKIIVFSLGEELLGGDMDSVRDVIAAGSPITWVPKAPSFIRGVCAHHGKAVVLVDLAVFLNVAADRTNIILYLDSPDRDVGLCVGKVMGVVDTTQEDVSEARMEESQDRKKYVAGAIRWGDRVIGVLDIGRFLSDLDGYF